MTTQSSFIDSRAQWPEIVMVANSLKFTLLTVQKETLVCNKPDIPSMVGHSFLQLVHIHIRPSSRFCLLSGIRPRIAVMKIDHQAHAEVIRTERFYQQVALVAPSINGLGYRLDGKDGNGQGVLYTRHSQNQGGENTLPERISQYVYHTNRMLWRL